MLISNNDQQVIKLDNCDALTLFKTVKDGTIDLILTDPPYVISKPSGMQGGRALLAAGVKHKNLQLCVQTDFGEWDKKFTIEELDSIIKESFKALKRGGTIIVFFDIWKITDLKKILEDAGFSQIRFIEWVKTNPVPINSKTNYLTNSREIALTAVKGGSPTFNSEYDNGIYSFPIHKGKKGDRIHPTQKSLLLFETLIQKHSKPGDVVLDCFSGSATTAIAALNTGRNFLGSEIDKSYFDLSIERIEKYQKIVDNFKFKTD
jgi:site-specific DNA-methyltransferase (adenine-specific)